MRHSTLLETSSDLSIYVLRSVVGWKNLQFSTGLSFRHRFEFLQSFTRLIVLLQEIQKILQLTWSIKFITNLLPVIDKTSNPTIYLSHLPELRLMETDHVCMLCFNARDTFRNCIRRYNSTQSTMVTSLRKFCSLDIRTHRQQMIRVLSDPVDTGQPHVLPIRSHCFHFLNRSAP